MAEQARASGQVDRPLLVVGLALLAFAWCAIGFNEVPNIYDEGLTDVNAMRILKGDVLYRDIFTNYGPAYYYLVAAVFRIFGPSMLATRLFGLVVAFVLGGLVLALGLELAGPAEAAVAAFVALTWPARNHLYYSSLPALACSLASCLAMHSGGWSHGRKRLLAAGALAGGTALIRHDYGAVLVAAQLAALVWSWLGSKETAESRDDVRAILLYLAGMTAIVAVPALLMLWAIPFSVLLNDLIVFPRRVISTYVTPFPGALPPMDLLVAGKEFWLDYVADCSFRFQYYFPYLALASVLALARRRAPGGGGPGARTKTAGVLLAIGLGHGFYFFKRPDIIHSLSPVVVGALLSSFAAFRMRKRGKPALALVMLGLQLAVAFDRTYWKIDTLLSFTNPSVWVTFTLPRARGMIGDKHTLAYEACIRYVQQHVPPDRPIFVSNEFGEILCAGVDELFYFLSERDCATPYDNFALLQQDAAYYLDAIVHDLEVQRVPIVVLTHICPRLPEGSKLRNALDDYLETRYTLAATFDVYKVLKRND